MINFIIFEKLFPQGIYEISKLQVQEIKKYDKGKVCCTLAVLYSKVGQRSYFGIFEKFFPQGIHIWYNKTRSRSSSHVKVCCTYTNCKQIPTSLGHSMFYFKFNI